MLWKRPPHATPNLKTYFRSLLPTGYDEYGPVGL